MKAIRTEKGSNLKSVTKPVVKQTTTLDMVSDIFLRLTPLVLCYNASAFIVFFYFVLFL